VNNILFNKFDISFTVNFTWSWTTTNFLWVSILSLLISACCRYQVIKTRNTVVWTSKTNSVCVWSVVVQRLQDAATDYCVMHHCCSSCLYQTYSQTTSVALCTLTFDIYHVQLHRPTFRNSASVALTVVSTHLLSLQCVCRLHCFNNTPARPPRLRFSERRHLNCCIFQQWKSFENR